jgi:NAD-dependent deacetylase sirtuin 7
MCNPPKQFVREFDVTEKTRRFCHRTGRLCYYCGHALEDTIVHFGERGRARWPLNWVGVDGIIEDVDLILCLGSSLKVLRGYEGLWCTDRPRSARPSLYIVNLQWTPKDKQASAKVHGQYLCRPDPRRVTNTNGGSADAKKKQRIVHARLTLRRVTP